MDNLRSLSGSLPTPTSRRQRSDHDRQTAQQHQEVLQAFKTAALSVTNLYRAATAEQTSSSYIDGYQDALEGLLDFLDKEDLGLNDGEGWRVRQYLAEKLAQSPPATAGHQTAAEGSEDGGADLEVEKGARSSSPVTQTKTSSPPPQQQQQSVSTPRRSATPPRPGSAPAQSATEVPHMHFTFQSGHPYPSPQVQDIDMDNSTSQQQQSSQRNSRPRHGTLRMNSQSHNRAATALAGSKRKVSYMDFFDIAELGNGKDGSSGGAGGGKRNRLL